MEFHKKYIHVGNSYATGAPAGWVHIVEQAIIRIEKIMWPTWMPMFLKRWIHYLATGNSYVRIKYWWAYNLRRKLTGGQSITDIKEKYARLRIYASAGQEIDDIIHETILKCDGICQNCGSEDDVEHFDDCGWWYNLCVHCRETWNKK